MKKKILFTLLSTLLLAACTKTNNNYYGSGQPAFTVDGITNITMQNGVTTNAYLNLAVTYRDSSQQNVTLSLSTLPAGIAVDTTWTISGIPTFNTSLTFYDTTEAGATPGSYPMTLTATSASGSQKIYKFDMIIKAEPPCTSYMTGKYYNCISYCSSSSAYADSVYADPSVPEKVWFTNFNNTGALVYGIVDCGSSSASEVTVNIPSQTVSGVTYAGTGYGFKYYHELQIMLSSPSNCEFYDE